MFHLIDTDRDNTPAEVAFDLAMMTRALASAFSSETALQDDDVREGFQRLGFRISDALVDLHAQLSETRSDRAAPLFDLSTPAVPDTDQPDAIPAGGFVFESAKTDALDLAMQGYFIGRLAADLEIAPSASAVEGARHKAEALTAALRKRDGIGTDGAPMLTVDETDAAWAEHMREFVAEAEPKKRSRGRNAA